MDEQFEYRGYIIRHRRIPTGGGLSGPGSPDGPRGSGGAAVAESTRDFWIISARSDADFEVLAGLAPSLEHAKGQIDSLID